MGRIAQNPKTSMAVRKIADGIFANKNGTYDLTRWKYENTSCEGGRIGDGCVPVYCNVCFPGTPWATAPSVKTLNALVSGPLVCGVAHHAGNFSPKKSSEISDDISIEDIAKYHKYENHESVFQPYMKTKKTFFYGHDVPAGEVLFYWHDHRADAPTSINAMCVLECPEVISAVTRYIADNTNSVALSLGTFQFGKDDVIAELSLVLVPGRAGCFGKIFKTLVDAYDHASTRLGLRPAPNSLNYTLRKLSICNTKEKVLETTLGMMVTHRTILKLSKTYPQKTNIEKYINDGLLQYARTTGTEPPKILTAQMSLATSKMAGFKEGLFEELMSVGLNVVKDNLAASSAVKPKRKRDCDTDDEDEQEFLTYKKWKKDQRRQKEEKLADEFKKFLASSTAPPAPTPPPDAEKTDIAGAINAGLADFKNDIKSLLTLLVQQKEEQTKPTKKSDESPNQTDPDPVPPPTPGVGVADTPAVTTAGISTGTTTKPPVKVMSFFKDLTA